MAFNGSGTFVRLYNWVTRRDAGAPTHFIDPESMDTEMDGFATGLSTAVTKDGQTTTTAYIPFAAGIKTSDGTKTLPGLTFINDPDTGLYRIGANNLGVSAGDTKILDISTTGLAVTGNLSFTTGNLVVPGNLTVSGAFAAATGGQSAPSNIGIACSVGSNALTIALKGADGNDPSAGNGVIIPFRNVTVDTGTVSNITVSAATSLVISSGSTMGTTNSTAFRLWIVGFNDGGTFRLGAINCRTQADIYPLSAWGIASSSTEGGAGGADSAQVFYSGTGVTSKAYVVLGYVTYETGLGTAGTWNVTPTRVQLFGHGVPLPNRPVQIVNTYITANNSSTTVIPFDNTIPQNTEGAEMITRAITPSSAANILNIFHKGQYGVNASIHVVVALFQDTNANALSASASSLANVNYQNNIIIHYDALAATTSSTTFKIRTGPDSGGGSNVVYFNANGSGQIFGGVSNSVLRITEIMG